MVSFLSLESRTIFSFPKNWAITYYLLTTIDFSKPVSAVLYISFIGCQQGNLSQKGIGYWHLYQFFQWFILEFSWSRDFLEEKGEENKWNDSPTESILGRKTVLEHKFENPKMCKGAWRGNTQAPWEEWAADPAAVWDRLQIAGEHCAEVGGWVLHLGGHDVQGTGQFLRSHCGA